MEVMKITPFNPPYSKGEVEGKRRLRHLGIWITPFGFIWDPHLATKGGL